MTGHPNRSKSASDRDWMEEWFGEGEIPSACEVCDTGAHVVAVLDGAETLGVCLDCSLVDSLRPMVVRGPHVVRCITCPKRAHKSNMVNLYDGEYQCQECRWGL